MTWFGTGAESGAGGDVDACCGGRGTDDLDKDEEPAQRRLAEVEQRGHERHEVDDEAEQTRDEERHDPEPPVSHVPGRQRFVVARVISGARCYGMG